MTVYAIDVSAPPYNAAGDADFDTGVGTDDTAAFFAARTTAYITGETIWIPANAPGKCYKLMQELVFSRGVTMVGENDGAVLRQFGTDAHAISTGTPTTFQGNISGSVLTVSSLSSGAIVVGQKIFGPGITGTVEIASFGTGTGDVGTYNLTASVASPVASSAMAALVPGSFCFRNFTVAANNDNDVSHKMDGIHLVNTADPIIERMTLTKAGAFNLFLFNCLRPRISRCVAFGNRSVVAGADFHLDAGAGRFSCEFNYALSNCKVGFYFGLGSGVNTGVMIGNQAITMTDDCMSEITTIAGNNRYRAFHIDYNPGVTNSFQFIGNVGANSRWNGLAMQGAGNSPVPGVHTVFANQFINCDMEDSGLNLGGSILIDNPADGLLVAGNLIDAGVSGCVGEAGVHVVDSTMVDNLIRIETNTFLGMSVPALLSNFKHRNIAFANDNHVAMRNASHAINIEPNYTPGPTEEWKIVIDGNTFQLRQHPDAIGKSMIRLRSITNVQVVPKITHNKAYGYTTSLDGSQATPSDYNVFLSAEGADYVVEGNFIYHFKYGVFDATYRSGNASPTAYPQINNNRFESTLYWIYMLGATFANSLGRVFIGNTGDTGSLITGAGGYVDGIFSGEWVGRRYRFDIASNVPPTNMCFSNGTLAANSRGVAGEPGEWTLTSGGWNLNWSIAA